MSDTRRTVQRHPIAPVWDETSRILILGSFPSVKSREANFFYGHPQNRFWRVLAAVLGCDKPESTEEKEALSALASHRGLGRHRKLRNRRFGRQQHPQRAAERHRAPARRKRHPPDFHQRKDRACTLRQADRAENRPSRRAASSTSPANAACGFERLTDEWRQILEWL